MNSSRNFKDVWCLFGMTASLGCMAFAFIGLPTLPIHGQSANELAQIARDKTRQSVLQTTLPSNEGDWNSQDIDARWQKIEAEDNSTARRIALERARQKFNTRTWPVLARRGYIGDRECWIVVSSWRATLSETGYFCGLTSEREKARMIAERTDQNTEIAVVEATAPYKILSYSPRGAQIGLN